MFSRKKRKFVLIWCDYFEKIAVFQKDPQNDMKNALDNDAVVCKQLAQASIMANKQMDSVYDWFL